MITGTLNLILNDHVDVNEFINMVEEEYDYYDVEWKEDKGVVSIKYEDDYSDNLVELIEKPEVEEANGYFYDDGKRNYYDDGEKNEDPCHFAYHKIDGKAVEETAVLLSLVNSDDLISELKNRGLNVSLENGNSSRTMPVENSQNSMKFISDSIHTVGDLVKALSELPENTDISPFGEENSALLYDEKSNRVYLDSRSFLEEEFAEEIESERSAENDELDDIGR